MTTPTPDPQSLPFWMVVFAFIASLLLTLLKAIETFFNVFRKSNLELVLTREVFFRTLESGESLYANVVLIAYDSGALIKSINTTLKKTDGATKKFDMKVAQIGEKYRTSEGLYQFSFHSSSPLSFIPENVPQRQVYICEHTSYADKTREEFQKYQQVLFQLKEKYNPPNIQDDLAKQFLDEINSKIDEFSTNIMDKIQIEPGEYTLEVAVNYRQKGKYFPLFQTKTAVSKIKFDVEDYARDFVRMSLKEYLKQKSYNFFTDQQLPQPAPEYSPSNVQELHH